MVWRWLGGWCVVVAILALVRDATHAWYGGSGLVATSLGKQWAELHPSSLADAEAAVKAHLGPWAWSPVVSSVLEQPTFVVFLVFAALLYLLGRRRRRVNIFAN